MTPDALRKLRADFAVLASVVDRVESKAVTEGRDFTEREVDLLSEAARTAQEIMTDVQSRAKGMGLAVKAPKTARQPRGWPGKNIHEKRSHALMHAHEIASSAAAEGRSLTPGEDRDIKSALADVDTFDGIIKESEETNVKFQQAFAVPEGQSLHGGTLGRLHPRVKAAGGSQWGETVLKAVTPPGGRYKSLVQSGSVPVTVPLNPVPVQLDIPVLALRQLIPSVTNATGHFAYMRQTLRENNAAVVARGARKPTSRYTLQRFDDRTRVIAHLSEPIPKQDLDDASMLRDFLNQEMRLGFELGLEDEIVNGDGTGEHFTGLAHVDGRQTQDFDTDVLVTARKAITKLERFGYAATAGWVMSPEDWETFELTQDNEARFYFGGPVAAVNASSRRLWGVPVVVSDAVAIGEAFLADLSQTRLQVRQDGMLDWSENMYDPNAFPEEIEPEDKGASDFERNMIRFRFEGRFGLEILRPAAIVEVELTAGS